MSDNKPANSGPRTPPGINDRAAKVWRSVVVDYDLEEWQLSLLRRAVQVMTDVDNARQILDAEGYTYLNRFDDPQLRPEVAIVRQGIQQELAIFQKLRLDAPDEEDVPL